MHVHLEGHLWNHQSLPVTWIENNFFYLQVMLIILIKINKLWLFCSTLNIGYWQTLQLKDHNILGAHCSCGQSSMATLMLQCWWILFWLRYYFLHTRNYRLTPWWIHWRKAVCGSQQIKTFRWETYLEMACRWTYNDYGILHTLTKKQVPANTWGTIYVSEWCGKK